MERKFGEVEEKSELQLTDHLWAEGKRNFNDTLLNSVEVLQMMLGRDEDVTTIDWRVLNTIAVRIRSNVSLKGSVLYEAFSVVSDNADEQVAGILEKKGISIPQGTSFFDLLKKGKQAFENDDLWVQDSESRKILETALNYLAELLSNFNNKVTASSWHTPNGAEEADDRSGVFPKHKPGDTIPAVINPAHLFENAPQEPPIVIQPPPLRKKKTWIIVPAGMTETTANAAKTITSIIPLVRRHAGFILSQALFFGALSGKVHCVHALTEAKLTDPLTAGEKWLDLSAAEPHNHPLERLADELHYRVVNGIVMRPLQYYHTTMELSAGSFETSPTIFHPDIVPLKKTAKRSKEKSLSIDWIPFLDHDQDEPEIGIVRGEDSFLVKTKKGVRSTSDSYEEVSFLITFEKDFVKITPMALSRKHDLSKIIQVGKRLHYPGQKHSLDSAQGKRFQQIFERLKKNIDGYELLNRKAEEMRKTPVKEKPNLAQVSKQVRKSTVHISVRVPEIEYGQRKIMDESFWSTVVTNNMVIFASTYAYRYKMTDSQDPGKITDLNGFGSLPTYRVTVDRQNNLAAIVFSKTIFNEENILPLRERQELLTAKSSLFTVIPGYKSAHDVQTISYLNGKLLLNTCARTASGMPVVNANGHLVTLITDDSRYCEEGNTLVDKGVIDKLHVLSQKASSSRPDDSNKAQ